MLFLASWGFGRPLPFIRSAREDQKVLFQPAVLEMESEPPLQKTYKTLFEKQHITKHDTVVDECELPLIDLDQLNTGRREREKCVRDMAKAKEKLLDFHSETYRWGALSATDLQQLSWSEAFHIPLTNCSDSSHPDKSTLRRTINEYAAAVSDLAQQLAQLLTESLGLRSSCFAQNCGPSSCYLRLNRYPPCPVPYEVFGLISHTDSDFLTILHQDQVGGLQLKKDGKWIAVKPNQKALIVNIGDLFQAWSNDAYKSVEHRVIANRKVERFSVAFFLCPSYDTVIETCRRPAIYRKFTFGEFRQQVQEDVRRTGHKIGLPRFLV